MAPATLKKSAEEIERISINQSEFRESCFTFKICKENLTPIDNRIVELKFYKAIAAIFRAKCTGKEWNNGLMCCLYKVYYKNTWSIL